jgi:polyhydroxybutyrate depolymerase
VHPSSVARKWCIDEARIYLTGQSDGGMAADAIAFLAKMRGTADAIAPSAAGVNGKDLAEYSCPEPLPVMVMHSRNDTVFPVRPRAGKCDRRNAAMIAALARSPASSRDP